VAQDDQQQVLTIKNNKIKYLERMLSMAEEDKRKQDKIIRRMTYNEEVLKKKHVQIQRRKTLTWSQQLTT
jgi:predicted NAD/FAD-binding protein